MKTLKSVIAICLFVLCCSIQSQANPITPAPGTIDTPLTEVRSEMVKILNQTTFKELGINYAEVLLKFKVNHRGQLVVLEMNSTSTELLDLVQQELDQYRITSTAPVPVDMTYHVKIKFEMK